MSWLRDLGDLVEHEGAAARVVIIATDGPTPRPVGAAMLVSARRVEGKIGRGEAQRRSIDLARELISDVGQVSPGEPPRWLRVRNRFSTGEVLGEATADLIQHGQTKLPVAFLSARRLSQ